MAIFGLTAVRGIIGIVDFGLLKEKSFRAIPS
jgi:hypothetical protein